MAYSTAEIKKGLKVKHQDKAFMIVEFQHVSPGKGSAFTKMRLKNIETGAVLDLTIKAHETLEEADVTIRDMQYLYKEGTGYVFMDNKNYEQVIVTSEEMGDNLNYLIENADCMITFYNNRAVSVEVPNFVVLKIVETSPNIKGDTSGGGGKPAKLETGLTVNVPFHLNEGESIRIDTRTNTYMEKVKV